MAEAAEAPRGGSRGRGRGGRGRGFAQKRSADYDYEDYGSGYSKKRKIMDDVYRFLVKEPLVRAVIGKGGEHIRAIKDEAKESGIETKVSIYAQGANGATLMEGAMDRVMSVQSSMEGLDMALTQMLPSLQSHHYRSRISEKGSEKLELRLLVPAHCCSAIIGKGGSVIKKIKEETKSYIQVYTLPMPLSEEHCVRIQNFEAPDLINTALKVFESIADLKGKSPITMYDPIYFEYGEYGDTGSYIDSEWYQHAIRSGVARPTTFKELRSGGSAHQHYGAYEEAYDYDYGYGYDQYYEYGYEDPAYYQSYVPHPRTRGGPRGAPRGAPRGYPRPPHGYASYGYPRGGRVNRARGSSARGRGGFVKKEETEYMETSEQLPAADDMTQEPVQ